jgi:hypothetical protein
MRLVETGSVESDHSSGPLYERHEGPGKENGGSYPLE